MMKRLLITGASGFIGRHTLGPLEKLGYEVYSERLDLFDAQGVREFMCRVRPTHLLHLAWLTTPGVFFESPENIRWVEATLGLARAFCEAGGQRFVGAGTCFETLLPEPSAAFYGFCKNETRVLLERYFLKTDVGFSWGRVFFLYGPHERPRRLVPSIIRGILSNEPVPCSLGNQVRDYLYVQDCADAFAHLVDSSLQGIFNIASGKPIQLRELILAFAHALGRPDLIRFGARPEMPGEPNLIVADNILRPPSINLEQGIARTIDYWRNV